MANSANDLLDQIEDTVAGQEEGEGEEEEIEEPGIGQKGNEASSGPVNPPVLPETKALDESSGTTGDAEEQGEQVREEDVLAEVEAVALKAQEVATNAAQTIFTDIMSFTTGAIGEDDQPAEGKSRPCTAGNLS